MSLIATISDVDQEQILRSHFHHLFELIAGMKLSPDAVLETHKGVERCLSGVPFALYNVVLSTKGWRGTWDECVEEQLNWFQRHQLPFIWCVDEDSNPELEDSLKRREFQYRGVFQGVSGVLDRSLLSAQIPHGFTVESISDEKSVQEFSDLLCGVFHIPDNCRVQFTQSLCLIPTMKHWVAKQHGKIVAGISTLLYQDAVSFWNGATSPEVRRQGISTALRCIALRHAIDRGCQVGSSFLMSDAMAFGICQKLGFKTNWRFQLYASQT